MALTCAEAACVGSCRDYQDTTCRDAHAMRTCRPERCIKLLFEPGERCADIGWHPPHGSVAPAAVNYIAVSMLIAEAWQGVVWM